jgi:hypothetical protein
MSSPYGWRASPDYFFVFILEAMGRIMISASMWAIVGLAFSAIWPSRVFIIIATLAVAYTLDTMLMQHNARDWTVSFIQAPDLETVSSLSAALYKQICYFFICIVLCFFALRSALSVKITNLITRVRFKITSIIESALPPQRLWMPAGLRTTFIGRLWVDLRAFCTPFSILSTIIVTTLCILIGPVLTFKRFTIGEALLTTFGGIPWADPQVDIYGIGKWILLLLPPMTGVAYTLDRELSGRQVITLYRYGSIRAWWSSKSYATILYAILSVCIMFIWSILLSFFFGGRGLQVYMADTDGFMIANYRVIPTMFFQFLLHVIMLTQVQVLFHLVFMDMRAGVIAYLLPIASLLVACSNVEAIRNIWVPVNWGMIVRSELFCTNGYFIGEGEWLDLCSVTTINAVISQILLIIFFFTLHRLLVRLAPITTKKS